MSIEGIVPILRGARGRLGCRRARTPLTARAWYEQGVELEATDAAAAVVAYERALARDPALADASCNLGRLLHEGGRLAAAESCYRLALSANRDVAVYWFNLGVAVEDQGRRAEAIGCYLEALARDPQLADAHFNLARLYERAGDLPSARAAVLHYRTYRALRRSA